MRGPVRWYRYSKLLENVEVKKKANWNTVNRFLMEGIWSILPYKWRQDLECLQFVVLSHWRLFYELISAHLWRNNKFSYWKFQRFIHLHSFFWALCLLIWSLQQRYDRKWEGRDELTRCNTCALVDRNQAHCGSWLAAVSAHGAYF